MASTRSSPVLVDQPVLLSVNTPDTEHDQPIPTDIISDSTTPTTVSTSTLSDTTPSRNPTSTPDQTQQNIGTSTSSIPAQGQSQPGAAENEEDAEADVEEDGEGHEEGDDSSNSESHSDSSTSTETPGTVSTPRSAANDSGQAVPVAETTTLDGQGAVALGTDAEPRIGTVPEAFVGNVGDIASLLALAESQAVPDPFTSIPPPPHVAVSMTEHVPSWVLYEEDTSTPTEDELRAMDANTDELNASDPAAIEKDVFHDVEDPEQRPYKKIRLSWTIKGVRGTRERPNRARIMTSPSVCIDGKNWNLKFFPRGNKSRNSLAVFVRCTTADPLPATTNLVGSFRCWEAVPDVSFAETSPILDMELDAPEPEPQPEPQPAPAADTHQPPDNNPVVSHLSEDSTAATQPVDTLESARGENRVDADMHINDNPVTRAAPDSVVIEAPEEQDTDLELPDAPPEELAVPDTSIPVISTSLPENTLLSNVSIPPVGHIPLPGITRRHPALRRGHSRDDDEESDMSADEDDPSNEIIGPTAIDDFRLSAQLGLAVYNPDEPRTCYTSSASHQFYPSQDDWGWDSAVSYWEDIHRRKHSQRQALLRNDTLVVDAYIRIYEDPTQALYWHSSPGEVQWDAKGLTGIFPVGTRLLYHSPATAGIIAWSLLAPFRKAIQSVDAGQWRHDSAARPRPLMAYLQIMLFQMRHMKMEELYVRLDNVIHEISRSGDPFDNVSMFWRAWRRSIQVETEGDENIQQSLNKMFGCRGTMKKLPQLPVKDVIDFQESATKAFENASYSSVLPDFLPLTLKRQSFDSSKRQWQLHNDPVQLSEDLDLSKFTPDGDGRFTLYGFIVHEGERTSGKFFSVLRPNGPGGKWLMFSDGNGNKVFSYTKKQVAAYEGLNGIDAKGSTTGRQIIHTALYIRTSCLSEYLPGSFEPYKLPAWLKPHLDEAYNTDAEFTTEPESSEEPAPITVELFWDKSVGGQEGKLDLYKLKSNDKARQKEYRQTLTADAAASIADLKSKLASVLQVSQQSFKLWAMNYHRLGGVSKGYMYVLPDDSIVKSCLNTSLNLTIWFTMMPGRYDLAADVLAENFQKIGEMHVKASPKPEPIALVHDPIVATAPETSSDSVGTTNVLVSSTIISDEAAPDEEQQAIQAAIQLSLGIESDHAESVGISNVDTGALNLSGSSDPDIMDVVAGPDAEQASVRSAVEQSVGQVRTAVAPDSAVVSAPIADVLDQPTTETIITPTVADNVPITEVEMPIAGESEPDSTASVDTTPPVHELTLPITPPEITEQATTPTQTDITEAPPAPQGYQLTILPDGTVQLISTETAETPLGHGDPALPVGFPVILTGNQIAIIQPNTVDVSAEDAALISSMIAADLEAAEREGQRIGTDGNAEDGVESDHDDQVTDSRPTTPRQNIPDVYGFVHVFDADKQKFVAHGTFTEPRNTTISTLIRKHMGYEDDKDFQLWKRDGTYRTVGVSLESTLQDASLTDCCEIIVGDHLGEKKIRALKAEAKLVDPGQLMRYIAMVQRNHPLAALESEESIEVSEFGGDYYKGPYLRGQRHGKECYLITQSGDVYEGPLVSGKKSGDTGKMTYQNGDVYSGGWVDNQKHGQGEFLEKRTGNRYVGGYDNDKRWGKGVTYWEQADQQAALCQVCYFEEVDALFYKCGHVVACYTCAKQCAADSNGCPVCRKPIEAVVKMYRS